MKTIYITLLFTIMFITGISQLNVFNMAWEYLRIIQAFHIISSLLVVIFFIMPFIYEHIYKFVFIKKRNSTEGWLLLFLFFILILSGFYLFLIGNRGGDIVGEVSFYLHQFGSFLLLPFLFFHIKQQQNIIKQKVQIIVIFLSTIFYSVPLYSDTNKLFLIKTDTKADTYHNEDWTNSVKCKSCHSEIFNQWSDSNHKHIAGSNPYYMAMETLAGEMEGEEFRKWCMGCHNPSALTTGLSKTTHAMDGNFLSNELFEKNAHTLKSDFATKGNFQLEEGVSCVACHTIKDAQSKGNASYSLALQSRKKYTFEDSKSDIKQWLGEKFINSAPDVHKQSYSNPLYKESRYCASCHNEFHPKTNIKIVSTFDEWEKSSFNNPKDKTKNKTCIDCHMTKLQNGKFAPLKGVSTDGGKIKDDVKVHYFAGSNHFLSGLKNKINEDQTIQLLKTSAKLDVDMKDGNLIVGVKNVGAGHHLPTGVADFRELWLDITVKDKMGNVVFQSGKLDNDGNIGKDARVFMKVFGDENNNPVGLLFWRYKKLISDTRIPAGMRRVETYELKNKNKPNYPLTVTAKLNFRIYPQWATNAVQKIYPNLPNPPVVELNKISKEFKR